MGSVTNIATKRNSRITSIAKRRRIPAIEVTLRITIPTATTPAEAAAPSIPVLSISVPNAP
ncbi:hypothetical protein GCM10009000_064280 [Halobacterium noricense]